MHTLNKTTKQRAQSFLESYRIDPAFIEKRALPIFDDAESLVVADVSQSGREHLLVPDASVAWSSMKSRAHSEEVSLIIVSAFRSFERQCEIVEHSISHGEDPKSIFRLSAPPGYSEHHTGCAIDIGTMGCTPLTEAFGETTAFEWLVANANDYGFRLSYPRGNRYGFNYEPWHWFFSSRQSK